MGRTVPSYREQLEEAAKELEAFRDALRGRDREAMDRVLEAARERSDAGHNQGFLDPTDGLLLSAVVALERRVEELEREVEEG